MQGGEQCDHVPSEALLPSIRTLPARPERSFTSTAGEAAGEPAPSGPACSGHSMVRASWGLFFGRVHILMQTSSDIPSGIVVSPQIQIQIQISQIPMTTLHLR